MPRLTQEQYLEIERAAIVERSEFFEGEMYVVSGSSHRHGKVTANLGGELSRALKGRCCHVTMSDLRLHIGQLSTYPDIVVVCDEPRYLDHRQDTLLNPTFLGEVICPQTERYFRLEQYRKIASLQEYALVSQTRPHIELYTRKPEGWLLTEATGLDTACRFPRLDCTIPMSEIYYMVTFEENEPLR